MSPTHAAGLRQTAADGEELQDGSPNARKLLKRCGFDSQGLTGFPTGDLSTCHILSLNSNRLTKISVGDFDGLDSLLVLQAHHNLISSLEPMAVGAGLQRMQELVLPHNLLTSIGEFDLAAATRVGNLRLDNNLIRSVAPNAFVSVGQRGGGVRWLHMSSNSLRTVGPSDFSSLARLNHLNLENNRIWSFHPFAMANNPLLRILNLRDNSMFSFAPGFFDDASWANIEELDLGKNALQSVGATDFAGLSALTKLSLDVNPIRSISARAFDILPALTELDLSDIDGVYPCTDADSNCYTVHTVTNQCYCPNGYVPTPSSS